MTSKNEKDTFIPTEIFNAIKDAETIVITAHEFPDGDAVGSSVALCTMLRQQGKNARILLPLKQVGIGNVLDGAEMIEDTVEADFSRQPDLLICLDCSEPSRVCDSRFLEWIAQVPVINIDHHGKQLFGKWNYVIRDYSSTGELIYNLATATQWHIDRQTAEAIWMALVTDTNRFSKPACTPATLQCAAALAAAGARIARLNELIYCQEPWNCVRLRKKMYDNLQLICNGTVAVATLERRDFEETGCVKQDASEFPLIPFYIQGVKIAAFIYLPPDSGKVRVSLRSRDGAPVTAKQIAEYFGGSGHEDSAGAAVQDSVEHTRDEFIKYMLHVESIIH